MLVSENVKLNTHKIHCQGTWRALRYNTGLWDEQTTDEYAQGQICRVIEEIHPKGS
jgi:hypothetical protein